MVKSEPQGIWKIKEHYEGCVPRTSLPGRLRSCHPHSSQHSHAKATPWPVFLLPSDRAIKQRSFPKDVTESPSFGHPQWVSKQLVSWQISWVQAWLCHWSSEWSWESHILFSHWCTSLTVTKRVGEGNLEARSQIGTRMIATTHKTHRYAHKRMHIHTSLLVVPCRHHQSITDPLNPSTASDLPPSL